MHATIKHYNARVSKLMALALEKHVHWSLLLPIDPTVLGLFAMWAGPKTDENNQYYSSTPIKSTAICTYLSGIKAWHLYRDFPYPHKSNPQVELILTTAAKLELLRVPKVAKEPILV